MKRVSLYSRSTPVRPIVARAEARTESAVPESTAAPANGRTRIGPFLRRWKSPLLVVAGAAFAIILVYTHGAMKVPPRELTQKDIDAAVLRTLETKSIPSRAAEAYELIKGSVVRVRGLGE